MQNPILANHGLQYNHLSQQGNGHISLGTASNVNMTNISGVASIPQQVGPQQPPAQIQPHPYIMQANGQRSTSMYNTDQGIREPEPVTKAHGLYFDSLQDARKHIDHPSWVPDLNDHSISRNSSSHTVTGCDYVHVS